MSAPRLLAPTTISGGVPTAGAGTLNTIALWTPDGNTLGNSLLTQSGSIVTNASGAIRAAGTTQTSPAFTRHDTTTSGIYFPATNEIGFTISNQHAMFISSGRNVGIGTTSPQARLHISGGTSGLRLSGDFSTTIVPIMEFQSIRFDANDRDYQLLGSGSNVDELAFQAYLADRTTRTSYGYSFLTTSSSTPTLRLTGAGNVGIGTASPGALLDVNTGTAAGSYVTSTRLSQTGTAANSGQRILFHNSAQAWDQGAIGSLREGANNNFALTFFTSIAGTNTERARIDSNGNLVVGLSASASASTNRLQLANNSTAKQGIEFRPGVAIGGGTGNEIVNYDRNLSTYLGTEWSSSFFRLSLSGSYFEASTSGAGLKLPATPGNADTQTLDCYSEGTLNTGFTLTGVTASAGNVNYEARWVRIGRAVSLRLRIFPDAGAQITFAAGANVVMTGTPAATSQTAMAVAANDGPSGRASALWDGTTVYLNTTATFGANVTIYFSGTAV